jgi:hypothetical protein
LAGEAEAKMSELFKDKEHLIRMAGLFVVGLAGFVLARGALVPADFGRYGHYRAGALDDNRGRPLHFAGRAACADCHDDVVRARTGSKHAAVGCEACHGALADHAADPGSVTPARPDAKTVCFVCHLPNVAKPRGFPQVDPREHGDSAPCNTCHQPHHPEV